MYKEFLDFAPTRLTSIRTALPVPDAHTEEALACLTYGIQSRKGFVC